MFKFDSIDLQRIALSLAGAAVLSFVSVLSAVGPARAAGPVTPVSAPLAQ